MRTARLVLLSLLGIAAALAQGNRGSITGTVTDPAGAVVVNVAVEGRNISSGALYKTVTTSTGNYTLPELAPGNYEVTFAAPGFKTFKRGPLEVGARQILRIDGTLEVGTATESITVTEAAPLLITESSEVGYNVSTNRLDDLPVGNMGSVRNIVRTAAVLMPGVSFTEGFFGSVKINGTPGDGYNLRIDGMDNTYTLGNLLVSQVQPSVDAIEQYSIQTSNFAAELGQAGGAIFNVNMKSGTNQFHGSAFDYWSTDTFYAAQPYTKLKSSTSNYDWGFTIGGPVAIPKVYNGHDKTFFFFSYETRPQTGTNVGNFVTVPTDDYRLGNLSAAMSAVGNKVLGKDPLGRSILQNMVYDPASNFLVNGQVVRNPFDNNQIPVARFDPVSAKLLALVPKANLSGLIQNYNNPYETATKNYLPSFKIDHNINASNKLNFFFSRTTQRSPIDYRRRTSHPDLLRYDLRLDQQELPAELRPDGYAHHAAASWGRDIRTPPSDSCRFQQTTPYNATTALGLQGPFTLPEGSTFPHFGSMSNGQGGLARTLGTPASTGRR